MTTYETIWPRGQGGEGMSFMWFTLNILFVKYLNAGNLESNKGKYQKAQLLYIGLGKE